MHASLKLSSTVLWLSVLLLCVNGQSQSFTWGWASGNNDVNLPECSSVGITAFTQQVGTNPLAQPPFYMIAYPVKGIPTTSGIGSDPGHLNWQVNYSPGTQLLLQLVDAAGNSGGTAPQIYSVTSGSSSSCHSSPSSPPLTLQTTATHLSTCDPFVLDMSGGTPPYTVSIVSQNSVNVENRTLSTTDNEFTWINRDDSSKTSNLLGAVCDATGRWAVTTGFVSISGPTDTTCGGKQSFSGTKSTTSSSSSPPSPSSSSSLPGGSSNTVPSPSSGPLIPNPIGTDVSANSGSSNKSKLSSGVIIGIAVGGAVLIALLVIALAIILRRKSRGANQVDNRGSSFMAEPQPTFRSQSDWNSRPPPPPAMGSISAPLSRGSQQPLDPRVNNYSYEHHPYGNQGGPSVVLQYAAPGIAPGYNNNAHNAGSQPPPPMSNGAYNPTNQHVAYYPQPPPDPPRSVAYYNQGQVQQPPPSRPATLAESDRPQSFNEASSVTSSGSGHESGRYQPFGMDEKSGTSGTRGLSIVRKPPPGAYTPPPGPENPGLYVRNATTDDDHGTLPAYHDIKDQ